MAGFLSEVTRGPSNRFLVRLAVVAALGGFLFGYDTGVIGGAMLYIKKDFHAGTFAQSSMVSAILIGAAVGALISGWAADAFSRRRTKIVSGCVYVVGALLCAFSQNTLQMVGSRFILGLAVGTASFVSPMYISENAPPRTRGGLTTFNQLMITIGIVAAYIVDWGLADVSSNWRWMLGLGVVPGLALAIGMMFLPYSPRWLVDKDRSDDAHAVLERTRGEGDDIEKELADIEKAAVRERGVRDLLSRSVRPMLVIGLALALFQQFVGVNTVIYYGPTILKATGIGDGGALQQSVFIGVTNVVFTIVAVLLLDKVGRRVLLLTGNVAFFVALVVLGVYFASGALQDNAQWLALAALTLYIAGFAISLGPVFWLMISEIFPLHLRAPAMAVCTIGNWLANFVVSVSFLSLTNVITRQGTFWLYAAVSVAAFVFFAARAPETKDKSLEEIGAQVGADVSEPYPQERGRRAGAAPA
ncbi:MAG TPA: sugar porter family MFS transporter [Acidothermaceae bacterium]